MVERPAPAAKTVAMAAMSVVMAAPGLVVGILIVRPIVLEAGEASA
jgi:hypothetical protein